MVEYKPIRECVDYYIGGGWGDDQKSDEFPKVGHVIRGTDFDSCQMNVVDKVPKRFHKLSNIEKY